MDGCRRYRWISGGYWVLTLSILISIFSLLGFAQKQTGLQEAAVGQKEKRSIWLGVNAALGYLCSQTIATSVPGDGWTGGDRGDSLPMRTGEQVVSSRQQPGES